MLDKFLEDYNSAVSICMVDEEEGFEEIKKVVDGFNKIIREFKSHHFRQF